MAIMCCIQNVHTGKTINVNGDTNMWNRIEAAIKSPAWEYYPNCFIK